jgi:K(+)-stimulated pyrophosphate-energized sodium pump
LLITSPIHSFLILYSTRVRWSILAAFPKEKAGIRNCSFMYCIRSFQWYNRIMASTLLLLPAFGALCALIYAFFKTRWIYRKPIEDKKLQRISGYVRDGAMAFLDREYRVLAFFAVVVAILLLLNNTGLLRFQALGFLLGASLSALSGYIGMRVATAGNARTTEAAAIGIGPALAVSFGGGTVMGMAVTGLSLLGIVIILFLVSLFHGNSMEVMIALTLPLLSGYSLGASLMALFARVGGGIFTKAADVGADLVGKVEAGIPEDDHRNPAVIADNVGDNVGDVAGMGADLFESYAGSIIGTMILGSALGAASGLASAAVFYPLALAGSGIFAAIIGTFFVRLNKASATGSQKPQKALNRGTFVAAIIASLMALLLARLLFMDLRIDSVPGGAGYLSVWASVLTGLAAGTLIGLLTEYYTGTGTPPVKKIVRACDSGTATNLITGLGVGMLSTFPSLLVIIAAILTASSLAGLYGIAVASLGMLMTLGIQLAVDAYGPIADNAGGLAEMAEFPPEVRDVTDKLDAVGNTTAAIGKGFAIGSAALTSIILFTAFRQQAGIEVIDLTKVTVLSGLLLGAVIPYLFSSMAMEAIGQAAFAMINEVRRQFREKPGILDETEEPDYRACIDISTSSALKHMVLPGITAALTPLAVGVFGGVEMVAGLLMGVTSSGVVLAIFMSNSGGAWDNAKKMIEEREEDGKGSEAHKAAIVGDTVGDPFKDTAGPSLNILIKLMAVVSLVIAPLLTRIHGG